MIQGRVLGWDWWSTVERPPWPCLRHWFRIRTASLPGQLGCSRGVFVTLLGWRISFAWAPAGFVAWGYE